MGIRKQGMAFFVLIFLLVPLYCMAKMQPIGDQELEGIMGNDGIDLVFSGLNAIVGTFNYTDSGYLELGSLSINDDGGGLDIGTFSDPITFDVATKSSSFTPGSWTYAILRGVGPYWQWSWTPATWDGTYFGTYLSMEFPDASSSIDPIDITVMTLDWNGTYIGSQVGGPKDAIPDLEIKNIVLNYLDSGVSHLYIATQMENVQIEYDPVRYNDDPLYPYDTAFILPLEDAYYKKTAPDQWLAFDTGIGISAELVLQARIEELLYTYNENDPSGYLKASNIHLIEDDTANTGLPSYYYIDYGTPVASVPGQWQLNGPLYVGSIDVPQATFDIAGDTTPRAILDLQLKGCLRIEEFIMFHSSVTDNYGPVVLDRIDTAGGGSIKIEIPTPTP